MDLVEKARFDKAAKLTIETYPDQPVYWGDGGGDDGGFFTSIEGVLDACEREDRLIPDYVWACQRENYTLQPECILEDALEYQEMDIHISEDAVKEFTALCDMWLKKHNLHVWRLDNTRVVLMKPDALEACAD